jgi:hypothetical protein
MLSPGSPMLPLGRLQPVNTVPSGDLLGRTGYRLPSSSNRLRSWLTDSLPMDPQRTIDCKPENGVGCIECLEWNSTVDGDALNWIEDFSRAPANLYLFIVLAEKSMQCVRGLIPKFSYLGCMTPCADIEVLSAENRTHRR